MLAEAKRMTAATHSDGTRQKMTQHAVDTSLSWLIPEDIGESGLMATIAELLSIDPNLVRTTAQEKKERKGIVFTHTTPPCLPASLLPPCCLTPTSLLPSRSHPRLAEDEEREEGQDCGGAQHMCAVLAHRVQVSVTHTPPPPLTHTHLPLLSAWWWR